MAAVLPAGASSAHPHNTSLASIVEVGSQTEASGVNLPWPTPPPSPTLLFRCFRCPSLRLSASQQVVFCLSASILEAGWQTSSSGMDLPRTTLACTIDNLLLLRCLGDCLFVAQCVAIVSNLFMGEHPRGWLPNCVVRYGSSSGDFPPSITLLFR